MRTDTGSVRDELRVGGYRAIAVRMKRLQDCRRNPGLTGDAQIDAVAAPRIKFQSGHQPRPQRI